MTLEFLDQLHTLEADLIELRSYVRVLEKLCAEHELQMIMVDATAERLAIVEAGFYSLWSSVMGRKQNTVANGKIEQEEGACGLY